MDATIAPFTTRLAPSRLLRFVEALVVQADPAAAEDRWAARNTPRVEIGQVHRDGLRDLYGWLTAADATYLDAALEQLSTILAQQGSGQAAGERRATAIGILATPARALALIQAAVTQRIPESDEGPARRDEVLSAVPEEQPGNEAASRRAADTGQLPYTAPEEQRPEFAEDASRRAADSHGPRSPIGCAGHTCGTITIPPDKLLPKAPNLDSPGCITPHDHSAPVFPTAETPGPLPSSPRTAPDQSLL